MNKIIFKSFLSIGVLASLVPFHLFANTEYDDAVMNQADLISPDPYTLVGKNNFLAGYEPINTDGSTNVVIEIPSGSNAKWEVSKPDGKLKWEHRAGTPRVVDYLSYPGNYGMIPKTMLAKASGGDGDPLDVLVLGPAVARGSIVEVKIIGVLYLLDHGEKDDKLIAVMSGTPLYQIDSIQELDENYTGISAIIEIWFTNYKGPKKTQSLGYGNKNSAMEIIGSAMNEFSKRQYE